jgi:hypothetical protein
MAASDRLPGEGVGVVIRALFESVEREQRNGKLVVWRRYVLK